MRCSRRPLHLDTCIRPCRWSIQIAGDTFDETYRFIGPSVGRARAREWDPPGDGPVLLVSLGTAFNNRPEFFRATADAFAGTRWQVVMAIGEHTDPDAVGPVPANVQIAARVPQPAVLRHATAFVSHAGMGSTMEALYHQVPLVAVPQVREQELNAARLQELGLGRHLPTRSPAPELLREAVEQVSDDPGIRARLADMRDAIRCAGGAAAGAEAVELYLDR
jgi:MGT family glycosyltransferase